MTRTPDPRINHRTGGAVYVEFLIVFIPVFIMFLGMLQAALIYVGNLAVQHSATTATRAAIVVLDDDPQYYGDAYRNEIGGDSGGEDSLENVTAFLAMAGLEGGLAPPDLGGGGASGGARMSAIRNAASIPLLAVSPSMEQLTGDPTIYKAIGGDPAERALVGAVLYNRAAVAVNFPSSPGANSFVTSWGDDEDVTVRVTYFFHCGVPLVSRLMCDDIFSLNSGTPTEQIRDLARAGGDPQRIAAALDRIEIAQARLDRAAPGVTEHERGAESPGLMWVTALTGARFVVLRAEATLPNQGADYTYASQTGE
jgi:hypothetical protein